MKLTPFKQLNLLMEMYESIDKIEIKATHDMIRVTFVINNFYEDYMVMQSLILDSIDINNCIIDFVLS